MSDPVTVSLTWPTTLPIVKLSVTPAQAVPVPLPSGPILEAVLPVSVLEVRFPEPLVASLVVLPGSGPQGPQGESYQYYKIGGGEQLREPLETVGVQIGDEIQVLIRTVDDNSGKPFFSSNGSQYTSLDRPGMVMAWFGVWTIFRYGEGGTFIDQITAAAGSEATPDLAAWPPGVDDVWLGPDPLFRVGTIFITGIGPFEIRIWSGTEFTRLVGTDGAPGANAQHVILPNLAAYLALAPEVQMDGRWYLIPKP